MMTDGMDNGELGKLEGKYINLLQSTKRDGIGDLIEYLYKKGIFSSPASSKFHGCYRGGLLRHHMDLYEYYSVMADQHLNVVLPEDSKIITSLLHDICKADLYDDNFRYRPEVGNRGHAKLSIERIKRFIRLTIKEETMIKYHMGIYHVGKEYTLEELKQAFTDQSVKLFHICDDIVSGL